MFQRFLTYCKTSEHVILQSQVWQSIRNARILLSNATTFNYGNVILVQYSLSSVHHRQCGMWQSRFTPRIPNGYWAESSARGGVSLKLCVPVGVVSGRGSGLQVLRLYPRDLAKLFGVCAWTLHLAPADGHHLSTCRKRFQTVMNNEHFGLTA